MKARRKVIVFITILLISFALTACFPNNSELISDKSITSVARVRIISDGSEHRAFRNWNHGFDSEISASGWFKTAEDVAEELRPFLFGDDFQIIIEGQQLHDEYYYFYKLTDGEWIIVLAVYVRADSEQIFLTHDGFWRDDWEEVYAESFLDLLVPGEYILDVGVWWGDSEAANSYNNFFRFIKQP